jgi:beta-barrel assembly-enhancing protease
MEQLSDIKKSMKYSPKLPDSSVNTPHQRPVKDLFVMLGGAILIIVAVYFTAGVLIDQLIPHIPSSIERKMGTVFNDQMCVDELVGESNRLSLMVNKLIPFIPGKKRDLHYSVCVVKNKQINALAIPGGRVVVYKGLIDKMNKEEELAFVLAHELAHFQNRDHLRRFGRAIISLFVAVSLTNQNGGAVDFIMKSMTGLDLKVSRDREKAADLMALQILHLSYENSLAAVEVMKKFNRNTRSSKFNEYFSTHPHPETRINYLKKAAKKLNKSKS